MKLPRFTLRELFLLIVIAAMGCGWWVDRSRLTAECSRLSFLLDFHSEGLILKTKLSADAP
jgi:hypothetical protein